MNVLAAILAGLKGVAAFIAQIGALLVPYWLGKSRQREAATEEALERLDDARENVVDIRSDPAKRDKLRDKYRR